MASQDGDGGGPGPRATGPPGSINASVYCRVESYEVGQKKCISDVRRTFCLFVTFDLLFITMLWIIELNVNGGIQQQLEKEVLHYDYHASFFDIFLLAVFRFASLILAYAVSADSGRLWLPAAHHLLRAGLD
ncbi:unnamed protein product [Tetraodon nigroviridis]|uniref:Chromosome undetermined SCAF2935, whole genome shotgun sequence n=1 Tax=Tetraodon nigroviridis TaxID=99883 RepID=Q4THH5_TETNG|nr:unnamed protein product [Tetraodon nigroviridis]